MVISHDRLGITRVREEVVIERYRNEEGQERLRGCNPIRQKEYDIYQIEKKHAQEQRQQQDTLRQQREQEKIQEQQQLQRQRELDRGGFEK